MYPVTDNTSNKPVLLIDHLRRIAKIKTEKKAAASRENRKYGRRSDWQGSWARYECERNR